MTARRRKLVVVGNGMAGARVVEEILKRTPDRFDIVMFGAEPYGNYNRILLSNVLNGTQTATEIFMNPLAWYRDNGIRLHAGVKAMRIDREHQVVIGQPLAKDALAYSADASTEADAQAVDEPYDDLIIATGSRPFVPPMEGFGGPGTFLFRTIDDCARIADCAKGKRRAAVIGGGLLGLEAARGLLTHGVEVTVLEAAPQLMIAQLDAEAGDMLRKTIEAMGIRVLCNAITTRIARLDARRGGPLDGRITHLELADGSTLDADMVVVSAGIRPIVEIATASGLTVNKGIVCDDQMRTSDHSIFAVGECIEHRGQLYGLVDPIWEQAGVLADVVTGVRPTSAYHGSRVGTKLKVMGVELASMGVTKPADADDEVVVYREPRNGVYKKLIVRDNRLAGAIVLGDPDLVPSLIQAFAEGTPLADRRSDAILPAVARRAPGPVPAADIPDDTRICDCNAVTKARIVEAVLAGAGKGAAAVTTTKVVDAGGGGRGGWLRWVVGAAALIAVLALALTQCGGGDDGATTTDTSATGSSGAGSGGSTATTDDGGATTEATEKATTTASTEATTATTEATTTSILIFGRKLTAYSAPR